MIEYHFEGVPKTHCAEFNISNKELRIRLGVQPILVCLYDVLDDSDMLAVCDREALFDAAQEILATIGEVK